MIEASWSFMIGGHSSGVRVKGLISAIVDSVGVGGEDTKSGACLDNDTATIAITILP